MHSLLVFLKGLKVTKCRYLRFDAGVLLPASISDVQEEVQVQVHSLAQTTAGSVHQRAPPLLDINLPDTCPVVAVQKLGEQHGCRDWRRPSAERPGSRLPAPQCETSRPQDEVASAMLTCISHGHLLLLSAATPCARCVCSNAFQCLCSQHVLYTKSPPGLDLKHQASR